MHPGFRPHIGREAPRRGHKLDAHTGNRIVDEVDGPVSEERTQAGCHKRECSFGNGLIDHILRRPIRQSLFRKISPQTCDHGDGRVRPAKLFRQIFKTAGIGSFILILAAIGAHRLDAGLTALLFRSRENVYLPVATEGRRRVATRFQHALTRPPDLLATLKRVHPGSGPLVIATVAPLLQFDAGAKILAVLLDAGELIQQDRPPQEWIRLGGSILCQHGHRMERQGQYDDQDDHLSPALIASRHRSPSRSCQGSGRVQ